MRTIVVIAKITPTTINNLVICLVQGTHDLGNQRSITDKNAAIPIIGIEYAKL